MKRNKLLQREPEYLPHDTTCQYMFDIPHREWIGFYTMVNGYLGTVFSTPEMKEKEIQKRFKTFPDYSTAV